MTTASTSPSTTRTCPRCGTVAASGQRFCRQCGHRYTSDDEVLDPSGEIDRSEPALRPVSRVLIALIIVLFVVLGALAALLLDDIRAEPDDTPTRTGAAAIHATGGTRATTNTD